MGTVLVGLAGPILQCTEQHLSQHRALSVATVHKYSIRKFLFVSEL